MRWFPGFYGFVGIVHEVLLIFMSDQNNIFLSMSGVIGSAIMVPDGSGMLIIGCFIYPIIAVILFMRTIALAVYLGFGPIFIAFRDSNIPYLNGIGDKLLKKCVGIVIVPVPMYAIFSVLDWVMFSAVEPIEPGATLIGVVTFLVTAVASLVSMYVVWRKTDTFVEKASRQFTNSAAAGLVLMRGGSSREAMMIYRRGPGYVVGRRAMEQTAKRGGQLKSAIWGMIRR